MSLEKNNISVKIIKECDNSDIYEVDEIIKNDDVDQSIKKINLSSVYPKKDEIKLLSSVNENDIRISKRKDKYFTEMDDDEIDIEEDDDEEYDFSYERDTDNYCLTFIYGNIVYYLVEKENYFRKVNRFLDCYPEYIDIILNDKDSFSDYDINDSIPTRVVLTFDFKINIEKSKKCIEESFKVILYRDDVKTSKIYMNKMINKNNSNMIEHLNECLNQNMNEIMDIYMDKVLNKSIERWIIKNKQKVLEILDLNTYPSPIILTEDINK